MPDISQKKWYIYKITNPEGSTYIGRTNRLYDRKRVHLHAGKNISAFKNKRLKASLAYFGVEKHQFDVIDVFENTEQYANGKEIFWIRTYMSNFTKWPENKGFNMIEGRMGFVGMKHTEESKKYMSVVRRSMGLKPSDSARKLMSEKAKTHTKEHQKKAQAAAAKSVMKR